MIAQKKFDKICLYGCDLISESISIIISKKLTATEFSAAVFLFEFRLNFHFIISKNSCFVKSFAKP